MVSASSTAVTSLHTRCGPGTIALLSNLWWPALIVALTFLFRHYEFSGRDDFPGPYVMRVVLLIGINVILAVSLQLINGVSGQFSLGHAGFMAVGAYLAGYATKTFGGIHSDADAVDPAAEFHNPAAVLLYFASLLIALGVVAATGWVLRWLVNRSRKFHRRVPTILATLLVLWFVVDVSRADRANDPSIVHPFTHFVGLMIALFEWINTHGAAASLSISNALPAAYRKPITFAVALLGGGIMAAVAGLVVGLPSLRLRGDYLAIATLGFAQIILVAIVTSQPLGAATGLQVPVYRMEPDPAETPPIVGYFLYPWVFGTAAITMLAVWRIAHSPIGRAIAAVREDEIAASACGINTTRYKVLAFVVGAFFAGVAGALYAHYDGYLNTRSFDLNRSIEIVVMVTLGGLGSIWGAAVAAVVLTALPEVLRNTSTLMPAWTPAFLKDAAQWVADNRLVVYALLLILIMLGRSKGLHKPSNWLRPARRLRSAAS